jgi:hypothetical protein
MLQNLQKAWQSFPAIYLSKIKVWGFPFAAYKNNVTRYLKTKHDARFKEQGVIVEWNRIDRSMANGTIAYIHPAGQQKATLTFFQQAMAQALSSVWFDELKNQPHFIAAWKQAAKQDHASEVFSPNAILPLLLPSTAARPQHQHRQKVLAAAARLAAQHDLPLKVRSNTAPSAIFNDLPKVNLAQVLRARVLVTPDPLAQAEKDFIKENPALEILPEQSLFWGRKNGVGKLYQVVRLEGRTQIAFKFLIEDFSQNPALEQAAMQQIKWIAAMVPGKLWQQLSTVHILPAQGKIQNLNWTTMSMRTTPLTLNGLAKLKLTFSLEDPAKKDLIIFLEEGLAPQLNSPGLAQLIARDLASWFNRNNP